MTTSGSGTAIALRLQEVGVVRDGRPILTGIDWSVRADQRWVVLGPNGSGKSTLVRVASLYQHPSTGTVEVLGEVLGTTDVRRVRTRIGLTSAAMTDLLRPTLCARDIVMTARHGALEPWWHTYDDADRTRSDELLNRMGCGGFGDRTFATLSSGERQRVLLARTLMTDPGLVLLDEPTAGLDLAGREALVGTLAALATDPTAPPTVLVTHHVDEIPPGFTHALLLRDGRVHASGPIGQVLTAETLSALFDLRLQLHRSAGRWWARADS